MMDKNKNFKFSKFLNKNLDKFVCLRSRTKRTKHNSRSCLK